MSLKKINTKALGPRLILSTTLLLICSLTIVSSIIYFLLASSLRKSDEALLERLSENYGHTYITNGVESLDKEISPEIMVAIFDQSGKEVFSKMPEYIDNDFEDDDEIRQLKNSSRNLPLKAGLNTVLLLSGEENNDLYQKIEYQMRLFAQKKNWVNILPIIDNDLFEIHIRKLKSGEWIQVGRSSEEREEHLASIRYIAFMVFIPFIFIGIILSVLMANGILRPIRELAGTIREIKNGEKKKRGKIRGTNDEIDILTAEFNTLLDKNDVLIRNIKETVDNVAHDLRTPVTRLRSSAEYALSGNSTQEQLKESLADTLENSEQILDLLNAIMDVAEAESQTLKIKMKEIQLSTLIDRLADFFQIAAEDKNIKIYISVSNDITISGDEIRLQQAFSNIIDNAIKYSPSGTSIGIQAIAQDGKVIITFSDQGIGIDESDVDKIWERLYRADKSRSTPGIGIGLSLVKAIINVHGGDIKVKSKPSQGTTFTVTLPSCNVHERKR